MNPLFIESLQIGMPRTLGDAGAENPMDREWTTGFFKAPTAGSLHVSMTGITGDGQADLAVHGGPEKAINAYPLEHYAGWCAELEIDLPPGAFGENFTTRGWTEADICVGDIFRSGDLILQVSQPRQPCWKLSRRWRIKDLAARLERSGRTGWYFRVLAEAKIQAGDALDLVERPAPRWTIDAANDVMHRQKNNSELSLLLAACPPLSASWKASLTRRAEGTPPKSEARLQDPNGDT